MTQSALLEIHALNKAFGSVEVLRGVDLQCRAGAICGLIGRNGSGKSTLLNCISGRLQQDSGTITLFGRRVQDEPAWMRARRGVAWTFQDASLALTQPLSALLAVSTRRWEAVPAVASELLEDATAEFENQAWRTLSFGQRKVASLRVALSRAPQLLLLDEPVSGLSPALTSTVSTVLKALAEAGTGILMVEHNRAFLGETADTIFVLSNGAIVHSADPARVFDDPRTLEALI